MALTGLDSLVCYMYRYIIGRTTCLVPGGTQGTQGGQVKDGELGRYPGHQRGEQRLKQLANTNQWAT